MTDAIGVLPEQVAASSDGQFFDVECYFLNSLVIIKVLKRTCFDFRNFENFHACMLHCLSRAKKGTIFCSNRILLRIYMFYL